MIDKKYWPQILHYDLKFIKQIIQNSHPAIYDKRNSSFLPVLKKEYKKIIQQKKACSGYNQYYYLIKKFLMSFKDIHLRAEPLSKEQEVLWPGFILGYNQSKYRIIYTNKTNRHLKNMELLFCDNKCPSDIMYNEICPYHGNSDLEATFYLYSPLILINNNNPFRKMPQICTLKGNSKIIEEKIYWRKVSLKKIEGLLQKYYYKGLTDSKNYNISNKVKYVSFPSFNPTTQNKENKLKRVISRFKLKDNQKTIVIDVRGNKGGTTLWGSLFIKKLLAQHGIKNLSTNRQNLVIKWRVSDGNYKYLLQQSKKINSKFNKKQGFNDENEEVIALMHKALEKEKTIYIQKKIDSNYNKKKLMLPDIFNIFIITDYRCASACLTFIDMLKDIANVKIVGLPTNADSIYMDARKELLPSKLMNIVLPIKLYQGRKRCNNEPYNPNIFWSSDKVTIEDVNKWINTRNI